MTTTDELPHVLGCEECTRLKTAEETAKAERNPSREVDYRVLARRHLRSAHGVVSVMRAS